MASGKEIRTKIASVKNTQKITKAMEMVATSKMRKTQERMRSSRPYSDTIRSVISHVSKANVGYRHPFLTSRKVENVGILVISTDRGLCGGLNTNLFKIVLSEMKNWKDNQISVQLSLVGGKSINFFQNLGIKILTQDSGLGDIPEMDRLIGSVNGMLDAYLNGEVDAVYIGYNKFINTVSQKPSFEQLIPITDLVEDKVSQTNQWDYLYEPDAKTLLDNLLVRYIESQVYQASVENLASEQAARMVAMKAATDNAGELIKELQLIYNKARQTSITNELNEIVAGAAAL